MSQLPKGNEGSGADIEDWLRRLAETRPGEIRTRMLNALDHFERSAKLLEKDREMASFRAITGEEEAATALMKAIQLRKYPHAEEFKARDHLHKMAVLACFMAIGSELAPLLKEFQLVFSLRERRIDVKIPLSSLGIEGSQDFAVQPVEPLDFTHTKTGVDETALFDSALAKLAEASNLDSIRKWVSVQANARNTLLYASDSALPKSQATLQTIQTRKQRALSLLVLTIMVLQTRKRQKLVSHAILAFLGVIARLAPAEPN